MPAVSYPGREELMRTCTPWLIVAAVLCLGGIAAAQETAAPAWLHVQITGDGSENVNVNLPLSVAEPMLALAPERILPDGRLDLAGWDLPVNVSAMRDGWRASW